MIQSFTRTTGQSYSSVKQLPSHPSVINSEEVLDNEQVDMEFNATAAGEEAKKGKKEKSIIKRDEDIINGAPLSDSSSKNTSMADDLCLICCENGPSRGISTDHSIDNTFNSSSSHSTSISSSSISSCPLCDECSFIENENENEVKGEDEEENEQVKESGHFRVKSQQPVDQPCPCCVNEGEQYLASTFYFDVEEESEDDDEKHGDDDEEGDEKPAVAVASSFGEGAKCKLKSSANWLLRFFSK